MVVRRVLIDPFDEAFTADVPRHLRAASQVMVNVAMTGAENRLADVCGREIRTARVASKIPDIPARILTSTRGKPPAPQRRAADLADRTAASLPRGEHLVVSDSGHYIHHGQPATVIAAINTVAHASLT